jgi:hypothetical protein
MRNDVSHSDNLWNRSDFGCGIRVTTAQAIDSLADNREVALHDLTHPPVAQKFVVGSTSGVLGDKPSRIANVYEHAKRVKPHGAAVWFHSPRE